MKTSKQYQVYLPTGADPADTFVLLRNGDIIDLVDNELGPLQVEYYRDMDTNRQEEYARYRNAEPSEFVIQVTEEGAAGIDLLRASDCPIPVQRRECSAGGQWEKVEHYGVAQFGQRGSSALTANGTDARDDLPAVRFPGSYRSGERYKWTRKEVIEYDKGSGAGNAPVGIIYCDDPNCANCSTDGCQRLFAITTAGATSVLETSADGGKTWATVATGLSTSGWQALYCYYGRVFIAASGGAVYYSDTPLVSGSWLTADTSAIPAGIPAVNFTRFAHPRKSHIKILYAIYSAATFTNGIAVSYDNGATWDDVNTAAAGPTYYDIAAAGSWVAAIGISGTDGAIIYSDDLGETFTAFTYNIGGNTTGLAMAMDLPNPLTSEGVVVYTLSKSATGGVHQLHKFNNFVAFADWTVKWQDALVTFGAGSPKFDLFTTAAGYLVWMHLPNAGGTAYIFKSIDGAGTFISLSRAVTVDGTFGDRFSVCPYGGNDAIVLGGDRP